jgi:hypothetical protein
MMKRSIDGVNWMEAPMDALGLSALVKTHGAGGYNAADPVAASDFPKQSARACEYCRKVLEPVRCRSRLECPFCGAPSEGYHEDHGVYTAGRFSAAMTRVRYYEALLRSPRHNILLEIP